MNCCFASSPENPSGIALAPPLPKTIILTPAILALRKAVCGVFQNFFMKRHRTNAFEIARKENIADFYREL